LNDVVDTEVARDHFSRIAPKWSDLDAPLRPSPDDTAVVQRAADALATGSRVVVLGLTPEIVGCDWPEEVALSAVDHSPAMMRQLWPPAKGPAGARSILADWCEIPIASASIDLVVGDGCYVLMPHPDGYAKLTREVRRLLGSSGRFVIRVFVRPDQSESVEDITRDFARGAIGSVHALKLRLWGALHGAGGEGTRLDDVWRAWKSMPAVPPALAGRRGWSDDEIVGIEAYRGLEGRYFVPTLAEFRRLLAPTFREVECIFGKYESADRCPTLVLECAER
jgi:SAM-dependent methyltransferase